MSKYPVQLFLGSRFTYNKTTHYYMGYVKSLGRKFMMHRYVWLSLRGAIPEGYHVHHIDGDKTNNEIENLECLPGKKHLTQHAKIKPKVVRKCNHCQKEYTAFAYAVKRGFCSPSCQGMARHQSGKDDEARSCIHCGNRFTTWKYSKAKTCSPSCSAHVRAERRRNEKGQYL